MRHKLTAFFVLTASLVVLSCLATAQNSASPPSVFISPMEGNLDGFIAAEIIKQRLPVRVVTDKSDARFVLVGLSMKENDFGHAAGQYLVDNLIALYSFTALNGLRDQNEGNVRLLDVQCKTMVWAGEAGDRSLMFDWLRRGGQRKIAQRIADRMKSQFFADHVVAGCLPGPSVAGAAAKSPQERSFLKSLLWPAGDVTFH